MRFRTTGWLLPLVCLTLLATGGCTHTSDGSVVIPTVKMPKVALPKMTMLKPLDFGRFWRRSAETETAPQPAATAVFPAAPQATPKPAPQKIVNRPARPRKSKKLRRKAASAPAASPTNPAKPLACKNVSEPGKRVRVVCD